MEKMLGNKPRLTDDVKIYSHASKLVINSRPVYADIERNGFQFNMTFINRTGKSLLVLTPQGGRFVSPGGTSQPTDGKCYFIQKLVLGPNIDLADAMQLTQDPAAQEYMLEVMQAQQRAKDTPSFSNAFSGQNVELEFRYELDCTGIESMPHGIKIDGVDCQIFYHDRNDANKVHFGRQQYGEVIRFIEEDKTGDNHACGSLAVYVSNGASESPVYVMNRYFNGYLFPVKSSTRPPGIHIIQIGRMIGADGNPTRTYVHIPVDKFTEMHVFTLEDIKNGHIKDLLKGKTPKDVEALLLQLAVHNAHIPKPSNGKFNAFLETQVGGGNVGQLLELFDGVLGFVNRLTGSIRK